MFFHLIESMDNIHNRFIQSIYLLLKLEYSTLEPRRNVIYISIQIYYDDVYYTYTHYVGTYIQVLFHFSVHLKNATLIKNRRTELINTQQIQTELFKLKPKLYKM